MQQTQNAEQVEQQALTLFSEEELRKINEEAENIVHVMNSDKNDLSAIREHIVSLGKTSQSDARNVSYSLDRPMKKLVDGSNDETYKSLFALRDQLESLNGAAHKSGISGFFSKLIGKSPMKNFVRKYETIETQIEAIEGSLLRGRDNLQESIVELSYARDDAKQKIVNLKKDVYLAKKVLEGLELEEKKPEWQQVVTEIMKWKARASTRLQDMLTTINLLEQQVMQIDVIQEESDTLIDTIENAVSSADLVLKNSFMIRASLDTQKRGVESVKAIRTTLNSTVKRNAEDLKKNAQEITKISGEALISLDTLKESFTNVLEARKITDESFKRIYETTKANTAQLEKFTQEMEKRM